MAESIEVVFKGVGATELAQAIKNLGNAADSSGKVLDKLDQTVNKTNSSMGGFNRGLNSVRGALIDIGGALTVAKLVQYSDTWTNISNRLKVVSKDSAELAKVTSTLVGIAQETRSSLEGTVTLYTRLATQAKDLKISQSDLAGVTRTVNQAIILSGTSAAEARGGLIQFAQGMASGRLQGEELRSVLENLPLLAIKIAEGLQVPVSALRTMGKEGELTTARVLAALQKVGPGIDNLFRGTQATISQSFTVLDNALTQFIGEAGKASGVATTFANLILGLARNIDIVAIAVIGFAGAWATVKLVEIGAAIVTLSQALVGLAIAAAANPIVLLATALAALAVAAIGIDKVFGVLTATFSALISPISSAAAQTQTAGKALQDAGRSAQGASGNLSAAGRSATQASLGFTDAGNAAKGTATQVGSTAAQLRETGVAAQQTGSITQASLSQASNAADQLARASTTVTQNMERATQAGQQFGPAVQASITASVPAVQSLATNMTSVAASMVETSTQITTAFQAIKQAATDASGQLASTFSNSSAAIADPIKAGVDQAKSSLSELQSYAKSVAATVVQAMQQIITAANAAKQAVASAATAGGAPGLKEGGQWVVPGAGGTDSQLVQFWATPGERVTVETPQQQRAFATGGQFTVGSDEAPTYFGRAVKHTRFGGEFIRSLFLLLGENYTPSLAYGDTLALADGASLRQLISAQGGNRGAITPEIESHARVAARTIVENIKVLAEQSPWLTIETGTTVPGYAPTKWHEPEPTTGTGGTGGTGGGGTEEPKEPTSPMVTFYTTGPGKKLVNRYVDIPSGYVGVLNHRKWHYFTSMGNFNDGDVTTPGGVWEDDGTGWLTRLADYINSKKQIVLTDQFTTKWYNGGSGPGGTSDERGDPSLAERWGWFKEGVNDSWPNNFDPKKPPSWLNNHQNLTRWMTGISTDKIMEGVLSYFRSKNRSTGAEDMVQRMGQGLTDESVEYAGQALRNALGPAFGVMFQNQNPSISTVTFETDEGEVPMNVTVGGFKTGGSFRVGGSGGADSKLVQFMASPNEVVGVFRPDQMNPASVLQMMGFAQGGVMDVAELLGMSRRSSDTRELTSAIPDAPRNERNRSESGSPTVINMPITVNARDADSFRRSEEQVGIGVATRLRRVSSKYKL